MTPFSSQSLQKQVFLKFYGTLQGPADLNVELAIFKAGDRNQPLIKITAQVPANPNLAQQVQNHWQQEYRPLYQKPRGIRPEAISSGHVNRKSCHQSAQRLCAAFNVWLLNPSFQRIRDALLRMLNEQDHIQVLIQTSDRIIQQLPWSEWELFKHYPHTAVDLSSLESRQLEVKKRRDRLRILGIFGIVGKSSINTDVDRQLLKKLASPLVEVEILDQPSRVQLTDQLWEQSWDMILFAGHGETTEEGQGVLYLNSDQETLSLHDMWQGLRQATHAGLQLAVFNSCAGLGLLARNLQDDVGIPQMIIMRDLVPDVVAQKFLEYFFTELAQGVPLYLAAQKARQRLQSLEKDYPCASWLPIIWQNPDVIPFILPNRNRTPDISRKKLVALVIVSAIAVWLLHSPGAIWLNRQGQAAYQAKQLRTAQRYFWLAAKLNHNYAIPRYNLALLADEKWGKSEQAERWYKEAAFLGFPEAIAQYSRLQLLKPSLFDADYSSLIKLTQLCLEQTPYEGTKASCLKNLGWIRVQQERWTEAQTPLQEALKLRDDSPHTHCLLAQVFEALNQPDVARPHWQKTLEQSQVHIQEQDNCLYLAPQYLYRGIAKE